MGEFGGEVGDEGEVVREEGGYGVGVGDGKV